MEYTDMEQRILDMWPKFEDGSYVQLGDSYIDTDGDENEVMAIEFNDRCTDLVGLEGFHTGFYTLGERVKRPAPKVLDADGVLIKVGDTVWSTIDERCGRDVPHEVKGFDKYGCVLFEMHNETSTGWRPEYLTHNRPDSWERLERDADNGPCGYFSFNGKECTGCPAFGSGKPCTSAVCTDIVRRAKALAKKEAGR